MKAGCTYRFGDAVILLGAMFFFIWCAVNRLVAGDEGYYLLASRLVMEGNIPYRDFFFPQMPLLPYVYGAWMRATEYSWVSARILSGGMAGLLGMLVYLRCSQQAGRTFGIIALFLYTSSSLVFPWLTVAKTYSLSTLLLFLSYILCVSERPSFFKSAIAGFVFGLTVNSRLFFSAALPLFYAHLLFSQGTYTQRWRHVAWFTFGGAVTAIPLLYFIISDFETFWFNNMGYHLIRSNRTTESALQGKLVVLRSIMGLRDSKAFDGYQFLMLILFSAAGTFLAFRHRIAKDPARTSHQLKFGLALPIAFVLGIVSFLPTPSYIQYFSVVVPFLCVSTTQTVAHLWNNFARKGTSTVRVAFIGIGLAILVIYTLPFSADLERYTRSGVGVIGISNPRLAPFRTVQSFDSLIPELENSVPPDTRVVATWPGYIVGSSLRMLSGLENDFGLSVAGRLSNQEKKRFRILTYQDMCRAVRTESHLAVILPESQGSPKCLRSALRELGYSRQAQHNDLEIFYKN